MTRDQAYALYTVLLEAQSNKLEKELLKKYVLLKLDLHKIISQPVVEMRMQVKFGQFNIIFKFNV